MREKLIRLLIVAGGAVVGLCAAYLFQKTSYFYHYQNLSLSNGAMFGTLLGMGLSLIVRGRAKNDSVYGEARFATRKEIKACGLMADRGIVLGETGFKPGELLRYNGDRHVLIEGPTRSGKNRGIVNPTMLALAESVFAIDLKGELYDETSGQRSKYGPVIRLEPGARGSAKYNPIAEIRDGDHEIGDIQGLAEIVCEHVLQQEPHWVDAASALLTATVFFLRNFAPEEERNLFGVLKQLTKPLPSVKEVIQEMFDKVGDEFEGVLGNMLTQFLVKTDGERNSIHSTLVTKLKVCWDPVLRENTCASDFSLTDLVNGDKPMSIYVIVQPAEVVRFKLYLRILVDQLGRKITARGVTAKRKQKLLMILDEFPTLGRLKFFDTALSYIAGYGVRAIIVCQSMKQLNDVYGPAQSISDNCYIRLFFTPNSVEGAEYISRSLGQKTVRFTTESKNSRLTLQSQKSEHIIGRPLLSVEELLCFSNEEIIILIAGSRPIRAKKLLYDKHQMFKGCKLDPPEKREKDSLDFFPIEDEEELFDGDQIKRRKFG